MSVNHLQKNPTHIDQLFLTAEKLAKEFSLFPKKENLSIDQHIRGLLSEQQIGETLVELQGLDVDSYIEKVVQPAEDKSRQGSRSILKSLGYKVINEVSNGPFYVAEVEMDFGHAYRRVGFICQERATNNGAWMPEHHLAACKAINEFSSLAIPIVGLIDTPGADAGEIANKNNQAHSISRLIAEFANADVPTLGIIIGIGYSGGAIPLATTNLIMSVRDGIFNTIQPKGLSSIARKYNLSWQECAQYVGVSPFELYKKGSIDGIIDFIPGEKGDKLQNLHHAIVSSILSIESGAQKFVRENPYILEHYHSSIQRYLNPTEALRALEGDAGLSIVTNPTEYLNVFGITYRYLRYLSLRKRIHSISAENYGRLSQMEVPKGELNKRAEKERVSAFNTWMQNPDKIVYDDILLKTWKNYQSKKAALNEERGKLAKFFLGEPEENYKQARLELFFRFGLYLYNRWKGDAHNNYYALLDHLKNHQDNTYLFRVDDLPEARSFLKHLVQNHSLSIYIQEHFSYEAKKLLATIETTELSDEQLCNRLASELNQVLSNGKSIYDKHRFDNIQLSEDTINLIDITKDEKANIIINRKLLEDAYPNYIKQRSVDNVLPQNNQLSILDIVLHNEFRQDFITECQNILIFDAIYGHIIKNLLAIAKEAKDTKVLARTSVEALLNDALQQAALIQINHNQTSAEDLSNILKEQFHNWLSYFIDHSARGSFLSAVEEWNSILYPQLSDTLFVIITFLFEKLLPEYYQAENSEKEYRGVISPARIGRRKDFWNRLTMAYNDLLIQDILASVKARKLTTANAIINRFFDNFEETNKNMITADTVEFPGFRISIEQALNKGITPCGVITGIASFKCDEEKRKVGILISNLDFQAGAFDMASAEKFCDLLLNCAKQKLPVVSFVSSGGMQTKEGAGALFSMAIVNDRITRFIRDNDLPILIFGFGDCTGGAQASFVTHPMVQTYYFSGTNMPFAGQMVVPSYLPSNSTLSNYLSTDSDAMRGLVRHPFVDDLDVQLRDVDPDMPVAMEEVEHVFLRVMAGSYQHQQLLAHQSSEENIVEEPDKLDLMKPVKRTLIHARGCTAVKLIRKAQENNIAVILVQSDPDMDSVAADMMADNDRVICIGGNTSDESYLNAHSVLRVAEHEQVDSLHPGIGFLSENSQFARLCLSRQINFIGPSVHSMETMGNKSNAINTSLSLNVPVVPGSHGILTSSDKAATIADKIGYPVLLKAVHGGGGKGIQVVENEEEIHELFHRISAEAKSAFGNGDVYLEKYITSLRHIEVQILRDKTANTKVLGLRDCSVQRNNQKVIEESGSTMLPENLKQDAFKHAAAIADNIDYTGAGTVEFIYDLSCESLYFMEMNTRLQVEHPVTEATSGVDIVSAQFAIASGESIAEINPHDNGFAIEVRITAERLVLNAGGNLDIVPHPGRIIEYVMPEEDYVEVISMIDKDKSISPYYDSLIAQIICHGKDRNDCANKMIDYLQRAVVKGICTNIPLLLHILQDKTFRDGIYDTTYLPKFLAASDKESLIKQTEDSAGLDASSMDLDALKIEDSDELKVISPSTGIFYTSPSPMEPEFVKVGDVISVDQTICLMEAMKIFTSIKLSSFNRSNQELYPSNQKYMVERINNTNGTQISSGDLLFVVRPCDDDPGEDGVAPQAA